MRGTELLEDIKSLRDNWDERHNFTLAGVSNLSPADLCTIELYTKTYLKFGSFTNLMKPLGAVAEVLKKYGVIDRRDEYCV